MSKFDQYGRERDWRKRKREKKREKKRRGERDSSFSLDFPEIRLLVFVESRGEVLPRDESFAETRIRVFRKTP